MIPCFQARVNAVIGSSPMDGCSGVADKLIGADGWPMHAFCQNCVDRFKQVTTMNLNEQPIPEGWEEDDSELTHFTRQHEEPPSVRMGKQGAEIGTCGAPVRTANDFRGCGKDATWMITLDFGGGQIGEAGACDEHIGYARSTSNFVTATPWVNGRGDNPLQAKMRMLLMEVAEGIDGDLLDEAHAAIDAGNYQALDRALDRIEKARRVPTNG